MNIPAKHAGWVFALAAVVFAGVWLFLPRGVESTHAASNPRSDSILYNFEGNVVSTRKGISQPAQMDTVVSKGDSFKTAVDSQLDLTAGDYAGFRLHGDGEIEVVAIQQTRYTLKLNKGTLLGNLKNLPTGMTIEIDTPTSIGRINVSGTQFIVHVRPHEVKKNAKPQFSVSYTVRKGRMDSYIKAASAAVSIIEGVTLDLTPETYIPSTHTATEEELAPLKKVNQIPVIIVRDDD